MPASSLPASPCPPQGAISLCPPQDITVPLPNITSQSHRAKPPRILIRIRGDHHYHHYFQSLFPITIISAKQPHSRTYGHDLLPAVTYKLQAWLRGAPAPLSRCSQYSKNAPLILLICFVYHGFAGLFFSYRLPCQMSGHFLNAGMQNVRPPDKNLYITSFREHLRA